ncbi:uncharacterized protein [Apostichopus japonicus]|uniref:uncharacterized protein n=1 Tax=Stichopus japonicus TaxID=307972 RepID=UPI003AB4980F
MHSCASEGKSLFINNLFTSCLKMEYVLVSRSIAIISFMFVILFTVLSYSSNVPFKHTVRLTESIVLECPCDVGLQSKWKFNGDLIFAARIAAARIATSVRFKDYITLFRNYSLSISIISFDQEGIYECLCNISTGVKHILKIEALPDVFISLSNLTITRDNMFLITENDKVSGDCKALNARPAANLTFAVDGEICSSCPTSSYVLLDNVTSTYSSVLSFTTALSKESGMISCKTKGQQASLDYIKYAIPKVGLSINDNGNMVVTQVERHALANATCTAYGSRPTAMFTWLINGIHVKQISDTVLQDVGCYISSNDTASSLTFLPIGENGTITCIVSLYNVNVKTILKSAYSVYVLPRINLIINGKSYSTKVLHLTHMEDINATCNATGARPAAQISWRHNDREILSSWQHTSSSQGPEDVTTYTTESALTVQPREDNGTISCIVSGVPAMRKHLVMYYTLTGLEVLNDYRDQRSIAIGIAVTALAVILLCGILVIIFRNGKLKWRPTKKRHYIDIPLKPQGKDDSPSRQLSSFRKRVPTTSMCVSEEKTTSLQTTDVDERRHLGFDRRLPQPPVSELPNAAVVNSESSSYQTLPCEEHRYYFTIKTMATNNRVFQAKDMCLIINLTKGLIYDRWMGTISVLKTDKKCVVITAVNESATQRADIHWDLFVKRVLELPHNMHLVKVEGICIDEEKLFLIQEHLSCEPLSVFLSDVEQQDYSLTTKYELHLQQRLTFARFILEGLQILHSYGFLHPGLSTHKVLLTNGGNCKLYDFCLSKDAFNTMKAKKLNITCNLNVSAPESYLRKEYDQTSDVWSMAVVIWELITGKPPFSNEVGNNFEDINEIVSKAINKCLESRCSDCFDDRFVESWQISPSLRPTIITLKTFCAEAAKSLQAKISSFPLTDHDEQYTPMRANLLREVLPFANSDSITLQSDD